jgi:hypothetical protein
MSTKAASMPGQHVGHPGQVDVPVDLGDVVGGSGDVVLDQLATLEHGDLGGALGLVDRHQVAADRLAVAVLAPPGLELGLVELDGIELGVELDRRGALGPAATVAVPAASAAAPARLALASALAPVPAAVGCGGHLSAVADLGLARRVVAGTGCGLVSLFVAVSSLLRRAVAAPALRRRRPWLGVGHGDVPFS